jgi:hypothetical protein
MSPSFLGKLYLTNQEGSNEVDAGLLASFLRDRVLEHSVLAGYLCNRGEEQASSIWKPIHPGELIQQWDTLESSASSLQYWMFRCVFRENEICSLDLRESILDDTPKYVSDRLWAIYGALEIPATEF